MRTTPRRFARSLRSSQLALAAALIALAAAGPVARAQGVRPSKDSTAHQDSTAAAPDSSMAGMPGMSASPGTAPMAGMGTMDDPIGIPMSRTGSGTTWLPDQSPMHAKHFLAGRWQLMLHGVLFVQYDRQFSDRGSAQFGAPNWGMLMASHPLHDARITFRGMISLDPFTVTPRGYPLLLQSGESYQGEPLHDRQHPHDLFMEIAAIYERRLARDLGLQLYLAPVGEPASGPVAFPHRPSASSDPFAPLGHHWQDATHIAFGVITAGLYTRTVKLEGSIFNGREPDAIRTNFDYAGRSLDSYAGRLSVNPSAGVSLEASYAYLASPEGLHPDVSQHRFTAAALVARPLGAAGEWSSALIYGVNKESADGSPSNSVLAEANLDLDGTNTLFARAEYVQKSAADLAVDSAAQPGNPAFAMTTPRTLFNISTLTLGYMREISRFSGGTLGLGFLANVNVIPATLAPAYGTRTPAGFAIFLRLRPGRLLMGSTEDAQAGMHMTAR
jgi:hypothetical protein